jgi:hypothetical protein
MPDHLQSNAVAEATRIGAVIASWRRWRRADRHRAGAPRRVRGQLQRVA